MAGILVGIDGSERSERALEWAACRAEELDKALTLISVVDPSVARILDFDIEEMSEITIRMLEASRDDMEKRHPAVKSELRVVRGPLIEELVDAAGDYDMIVLGSHHGATVKESLGGAKGLKVSASVDVPCAIIPADWSADYAGEGVLVGIGPDGASESAIMFAAQEALREGRPLEMISSWDRPALFSRSDVRVDGVVETYGEQLQHALDARIKSLNVQHPDLVATGEAIEASPAGRVLVERSEGKKMLVLGTHSRSALGRALFGSVCHSVLLNLKVPTVVVPQS